MLQSLVWSVFLNNYVDVVTISVSTNSASEAKLTNRRDSLKFYIMSRKSRNAPGVRTCPTTRAHMTNS